ncbi:hypothetical protein [Pseudomonas sp. B21-035]|uniref:hypothetical protein n=1 Tax=Pseudomonas sp. B21-035 TaxID=2895484 RepID=UPI000FAE2DBA|nr:hypothetical protein [Pseudomonas sp. B21-035]UVL53962.1 hypothetical protein LOY22_13800 [Pseudomonas sp. B21-035]
MSDISKNIVEASFGRNAKEVHRKYAVAAALEVIAARAPAMAANGQLESEMRKLSEYADLIEAALAVE